jgi:ankyrin repeat protein
VARGGASLGGSTEFNITELQRMTASCPPANVLTGTIDYLLHAAVLENDEWGLRVLLAIRKTPVDERDPFGRTALHYASLYQRWNLAEILSLHGADPLAVDRLGDTPIDLLFLEGDDPLDDDIRWGPGFGRDRFDEPASLH